MSRILKSIRALIGSQWSVYNTGATCSCFFAPATSLAAAFCTCCSLFISLPGSPVRTPLHESSLDITNACASLAQLSWSRCLLILPMFLIKCHDHLHMLLICFVSNRCESIMTPRFRAFGFGGIVHPLMLMSGITSELENLDVKWTISVLIVHQNKMSLM